MGASTVLFAVAAPAGAASSVPGGVQASLPQSPLVRHPALALPGGGSGGSGLARTPPVPVREVVADRTATSSTWQNSDGTLTVRQFLSPQFYQSGSQWLPVSPTLAATAGQQGWWHSQASDLPVSFGPAGAAGGAEQLTAGGARVGLAPLGVSDPSQAPQVAGDTATYPGLWADADLSEQVQADAVDEAIVLTGPGAGEEFDFRLSGATARPDAAGGLDVLAGGRQVGLIPPLSVTSRAVPQLRGELPGGMTDLTAASGARLTVAGDVIQLSVSAQWLASLPSSAFPVTIDPTFQDWGVGATALVSVSSSASPRAGVMQNGVDSAGHLWRSAAYITAPALPPQE